MVPTDALQRGNDQLERAEGDIGTLGALAARGGGRAARRTGVPW
jgi:hypothetical protein